MALEQHWPAVQSGIKAVNLDPDWPDGHLTLARAQLNYGEVSSSFLAIYPWLAHHTFDQMPGKFEFHRVISCHTSLRLHRFAHAAILMTLAGVSTARNGATVDAESAEPSARPSRSAC